MNKSMRVVLIIVALYVASGSVSGLLAQQLPIAGGYQEASKTDREVRRATRFAIRKEKLKRGVSLSLITIESAETQVVAGINYKLCLRVKINGVTQDATAIVYQDLKRKYTLAGWETAACQKRE